MHVRHLEKHLESKKEINKVIYHQFTTTTISSIIVTRKLIKCVGGGT